MFFANVTVSSSVAATAAPEDAFSINSLIASTGMSNSDERPANSLSSAPKTFIRFAERFSSVTIAIASWLPVTSTTSWVILAGISKSAIVSPSVSIASLSCSSVTSKSFLISS